MTTRGMVQVKDGNTLEAVRDLLRTLIDSKMVDALLVPMRGANNSVMPALVRSATRLDHADPLAPVMAFNSARLVSVLTRENPHARIGVVLRSCEIRALIELVKFNQASLDQTIIVGVDCYGTYTVPAYTGASQQSPDLTAQMLSRAKDALADDGSIRSACAMCERPTPTHADISIGFIGVDSARALLVEMKDEIAAQLELAAEASIAAAREKAVASLVARRIIRRDAEFKQFREQVHTAGTMASYFANCLECTNCMNACPICYCKECFFRTANAEHDPRELLRAAERQGAVNVPSDALLFQLTRLNHMATSCVGCGICEAACPHDIPLTAMFRSVGARVQKIFEYEPGRDVNEKPPFMDFKRDELLEIGEGK